MNFVRLNNLSLKYRFTPSDYIDIGIRKFEFVGKTPFLITFVLKTHNK